MTNINVLIEIGVRTRRMLAEIKQRKLRYYGHVRRHDTMQKMILEGRIEGRRARGRQRKTWLENIKTTTERTMAECRELALEREDWRTMISNLCKETEPR